MINQSSGQNIGRLGERWFQYILPKEWIFQLPNEDIGIDGTVMIMDSNKQISGHEFYVQIKTSKEWTIQDGFIQLNNLKLSTVKYWSGRLSPVMLVLYDELHDIGYYSWVTDTWEKRNPIEYLKAKNKTISLSIDAKNILSKYSWDSIKNDVFNFYVRIVTSFEKLNFLPLVNKLITCLWYLQQIISIESQGDDEKHQDNINIIISYKNILDVLKKIQEQYSFICESDFSERVKQFYDSLKIDVESFIKNFGETVQESGPPTMVLINEQKFKEKTPLLILKVLNFLMEITKQEGILDQHFQQEKYLPNNDTH